MDMMDFGTDRGPVQMAGLGPGMGFNPTPNFEMMSASMSNFHHDANYPSSLSTSSERERNRGVKRQRERRHGDVQSAKERRSRTIFNLAQLNALERIFMDVEYPDGEMKAKIAERLDVDEGTIQIWFQNRRAKKKRLERGQPVNSDLLQQGPPVSIHGPQGIPMGYPLDYQYHPHPGSINMSAADGYNQLPFYQSTQGLHEIPGAAPGQNGHRDFHETGQHWDWMPPGSSSPGPPLKEINSDLTRQGPHNPSMLPGGYTSLTSSKEVPRPKSADSLQSPKDSKTDIVDKIRKWPVKEPPTPHSTFGKLDNPILPRVCIRHDTANGRNLLNDRLKDRAGRDMQSLRRKILKSDPPKSPPPNQTCAAIPRSQRNELELALIKHGFVDDAGSDGESTGRGSRFGGHGSDELTSSTESSDSEGLAPPRRRRKFVRGKRSLAPNRSCTTVPLSDRTLPCLGQTKIPTRKSTLQLDDSDWSTSSDDSPWDYYESASKRTKVESDIKEPPHSIENIKHEPLLEKDGPRSAPAAIDAEGSAKVDADEDFKKPTETAMNEDESSEMALAKEFAEMLPSPFGCFLPVYEQKKSSKNGAITVQKRQRIQSDPVVISSSVEPMGIPKSGPDSSHIDPKASPSSLRSTASPMSDLSQLLGLPVSPNEFVSSLSDAQLDPPTPSGTVSGAINGELAMPQKQAGVFPTPKQELLQHVSIPKVSQSLSMKSMHPQQEVGMPMVRTSTSHPVMNNYPTNFQNSVQNAGVIRPVPTHAVQDVPLKCLVPNYPVANMNGGNNSDMFKDHVYHGNQNGNNNNAVPYSHNQLPFQQDRFPPQVSCTQNVPSGGFHYNPDPYNPHHPSHHEEQGHHHQQHHPQQFHHQQDHQHHHLQPQVSSVPEIMPASVVHHQPPPGSFHSISGPRNLPRSSHIAHNDRNGPIPVVRSPAARPNSACSQVQSPASGPPTPSSDSNLPPNQVCTAVPDAVSSEGLMARYLAWTQGRAIQT